MDQEHFISADEQLRGPALKIRDRVSAVVLSFILVTIVAVGVIAVLATNNISNQAQEISSQSIRSQSVTYMEQLTASSGEENDLILDRAAKDVLTIAENIASIYHNMGDDPDFNYSAFWPVDDHMYVAEDGQLMNGTEDLTSVYVPIFQEVNQAVIRDIELGGYIEFILDSIFKNNPNAEAVYFATPNEVTRYYPNIGLGALVGPEFQVTGRPWYSESIEAFSQASTGDSGELVITPIWSSVYLDATGLGLVTTVAAPVVGANNQLIGVVGLDVTLDEVRANLQTTNVLQSGYFFLVDGNGSAIILPNQGYLDILSRQPEVDEFGPVLLQTKTAFKPVIDQMVAGESGFSTLNLENEELFIAYAPLSSTGWSLGSVVRAQEVLGAVASLQQDLSQTTTRFLLIRLLPILVGISILIVIISLQGCVPLLVGRGAAAGVSVIHNRRTAGAAMEDQNIELKAVRLEYDDPEIKERTSVSATSYNMLVLLTGQAETTELRTRYVEKIKQIPHVKKVVNEIQVGPSSTLAQNSNDSYITSKVKLKIFDIEIPDFDPTRVKIITEMGTVYLMGLLTHQEADAVVEKARYVKGVTRVVKVFEYID